MKMRWDLAAVAAILVCSAAASAAVASDTNAPQLKSFQFSPAVIDASTNDQFITITARATDDLSGLHGGYDRQGQRLPGVLNVVFASPVPNSGVDVSSPLREPSVLPFSPLDTTWAGQLRVPRNSHRGIWTLEEIRANDAAGNVARFTALDLIALGFPITFENTGIEDRTPPELLSLTLETNRFETSAAGREVKFSGRIREELSGFGAVDDLGRTIPSLFFIQMVGRSQTRVDGVAMLGGSDPVGIAFEGSLRFRPYCEPGVWRLELVHCSDNAGNRMSFSAASELAQSIFVEITGPGDTNAPQIKTLTFSPRRIDTSTNWQSVAVKAEAVDDLSGLFTSGIFTIFPYASATFLSPSRKQQVFVSLSLFAGGDRLDSALTNGAFFPQYSESGVWTLGSFALGDVAGNRVVYETSALQQFGIPTELAVGVAPKLSISRTRNSILFSWPAWASDMNVETSDALSGGTWQRLQTSPLVIGEKVALVITPPASQQFYRLAAAQ